MKLLHSAHLRRIVPSERKMTSELRKNHRSTDFCTCKRTCSLQNLKQSPKNVDVKNRHILLGGMGTSLSTPENGVWVLWGMAGCDRDLRSILFQFALQRSSRNIESACSFRNVSARIGKHSLNMFPLSLRQGRRWKFRRRTGARGILKRG